jgi:hypothetical protein
MYTRSQLLNRHKDSQLLEEDEIERFVDSPIISLFPLLRCGIYHRTKIKSYYAIQASGSIMPNRGQFEFTYQQSEHSFGFQNGYISLFDFESTTEEYCISTQDTWVSFFFDCSPITIVLRLDRDMLDERLIPNSAAPKGAFFIPYVDVWYPEPIPVAAIKNYIIVFPSDTNGPTYYMVFDSGQKSTFETFIKRIEEG